MPVFKFFKYLKPIAKIWQIANFANVVFRTSIKNTYLIISQNTILFSISNSYSRKKTAGNVLALYFQNENIFTKIFKNKQVE